MKWLVLIVLAAGLFAPASVGATPRYDGQWSVNIVGTRTDSVDGTVEPAGWQNILIVLRGRVVQKTPGAVLYGSFDPATGVARLKYVYFTGQAPCAFTLRLRPWTLAIGTLKPPAGTGKGSLRCVEHIPSKGSGTWVETSKVSATVVSRFTK